MYSLRFKHNVGSLNPDSRASCHTFAPIGYYLKTILWQCISYRYWIRKSCSMYNGYTLNYIIFKWNLFTNILLISYYQIKKKIYIYCEYFLRPFGFIVLGFLNKICPHRTCHKIFCLYRWYFMALFSIIKYIRHSKMWKFIPTILKMKLVRMKCKTWIIFSMNSF